MSAEPVLSLLPDTGTVDANNPWPGLAAFREVDRGFFRGRESETEELLGRVLRERLTILFGLSGFGKTSLLQAGLFPRIRGENILPVSIRLDYSETRRALKAQIRDAIARAAAEAGIEAPVACAEETLWEFFHRQGAEFWNPRNRLVTPLLVFDQFEEIFTLGQGDIGTSEETAELLEELTALCKGTPSATVRTRLEANPSEARKINFNRHPYKILFSLREDFLPLLEDLSERIGSPAHNRMRLLGMNGDNAFEVVTQTSHAGDSDLIDEKTAERVVRFVAGQDEGVSPLSVLDVDPALLSFVCRELNNQRRSLGETQITADLLQGTRETIFVDFYERSVGDLDPRVRTFIEDHLLTKSGYRDSMARETALETPGLTGDVLTTLIDRRLLRIEDRGGLPRVELTHDVLTGVIKTSRDTRRQREDEARAEAERQDSERRQREAREAAEAARQEAERREKETRRQLRRSRLVIGALGLLILAVLILAVWACSAQRRAQEALASAEVERALHTLQEGHSAKALAYLAHAIRIDPDNLQARSELTDLLLQRAWLLPTKSLGKVENVQGIRFSQDGRRVLVFDQRTAWVWETATGRQVGPPVQIEGLCRAALSKDGRFLFTLDQAGHGRLWAVPTGELLGGPVLSLGNPTSLELSPDGLLVAAVSKEGTLDLYETGSGVLKPLPSSLQNQKFTTVTFGPQDSRLATVSRPISSSPKEPEEIILWDIDGENRGTVSKPLPYGDLSLLRKQSISMRLIPGGRIAASKFDKSVVCLDFFPGRVELSTCGPPENTTCAADESVDMFEMSQEGRVIIVISRDHILRVWFPEAHQTLAEPLEGIASATISPDGSLLATLSSEGQVRLWSIQAGRADPVEISPQGDRIAAISLASLAEAVAGSAVAETGKLAPLANPVAQLTDLRQKTASAPPGEASISSLTRWFLSDPWKRTISPLSPTTVPEFIHKHLAAGTAKAREEAEKTYPGHPLLSQ